MSEVRSRQLEIRHTDRIQAGDNDFIRSLVSLMKTRAVVDVEPTPMGPWVQLSVRNAYTGCEEASLELHRDDLQEVLSQCKQ